MSDRETDGAEILTPEEITLSKDGVSSFTLRVRGGELVRDVQVVNPLPLERELRFISFLDRKGNELALVRMDGRVPPATAALIAEALGRRHLRSLIRRIDTLEIAGNSLYFSAETDRGPCMFVVKNLADNILHLSPEHLVIVDAHENRYEILDTGSLDLRSKKLLNTVL